MIDSLQYVLNSIIGIVITYMVTTLSRLVREFGLIRSGVCALLHNQFYQTCERYLDRGYITTHELEDLDKLYGTYRGWKLNGAGEELYARCKKLEIRR